MNPSNIIIVDTNGPLTEELLKVNLDLPAISASLTNEVAEARALNILLSNVRISSIPNIDKTTFISFLAYNGTLGYSKKVFTSVVKQDKGVLDVNNLPSISYDPNTILSQTLESLDDVVLDIKMYNGVVDVLRYSEGILNNGEKSYFVKSRRSFPTQITELPNTAGKKVFMDGWYSYTTILFRDISSGSQVFKNSFYGYKGFIFKASEDGHIMINDAKDIFIVGASESTIEEGTKQVENIDYGQLLFSLNESAGISPQAGNLYAHSQILVTDQISDAIIQEAVNAAYVDCSDNVDFQAWQKLSLKRMAATVMFQNELFENAQIIMESARPLCSSGKCNNNCK